MDTETANKHALRAITEASWQWTVVGHARRAGWFCHFVPDNLYRKSFRDKKPMDLGDKGYPDITFARNGEFFFAELKSETGVLSDDQKKWRDRILSAGIEWHLWRPRDLDNVIKRLWGDRAVAG
jgi:hypothetical protein